MYVLLIASWIFCIGGLTSLPITENDDMQLENDLWNRNATADIQHAKIGSKVCMTDLGCFEITGEFFNLLYRPINVLPKDRVTIDTQFQLYTKKNAKEPQVIHVSRPAEIKSSSFNPKVPTKFIVHGFIENKRYGKWLIDLKDELLIHGDYNVIIVDWSKGNGAPYTQAAANTRVVGAEIALLITTLEKLQGLSPMNCHILGHSLGSHIAGYAGERLNKLGRISGIDPAEPYFQNMPTSVRLDPTDADFVDVIHTDSKSMALMGLGMSQLCGHVDFFPNNGKNQPGCTTQGYRSLITDGLIEATRRFLACNHQRSVDFFHASLNYKNSPPVGYECPSWEDYLKGRCAECGPKSSKCAIMGIRADEFKPFKNDATPLKLYLSTSGKEPFWLNHYQVSVKLAKPSGYKDNKGKLSITLSGSKKNFKTTLTPQAIDLHHGATYPFLVVTNDDLGEIKSIIFSWESSSWSIFRTQTIFLDHVKLLPMNVINEEERKKQTKTFCESQKAGINAKATKDLTNTKC